MRLWDNKKGKSIGSDSPFWVVIKIEYHRFFGVFGKQILLRINGRIQFAAFNIKN
jgi:hypothetical protein